MNLIYYVFFVVYFFSTSNQVESKLSHVKVTHKNGAKIYTIGGKKFKTFRNAHSYNKRRSKLSKKKPFRRPKRRLTRKNTRGQLNRIIKRRPTSKSDRFQPRFQPLVPKNQPTQPPRIATTTTKVNEFAEQINNFYKEINEHRNKHKADPLNVNAELVKKAEECAKDETKRDIIDPNAVRNIARVRNVLDNPVDFWYSQKGNYDFDNPEHRDLTKEFIHMVWKSATDIGCGMAKTNEEYYICCDFSPVENVKDEDEMKKNVLKE